jgi:uncharacterized membrane protein YebE (DUF533 family)
MDLDRVLKALLESPAASGLAGALAGGLLLGKGGRKLGKRALEVGGMAALAGLAYRAWQAHQRNGAAGEPSVPKLREAGFLPDARSAAGDELGSALFRAMLAAARSDGRLDLSERQALVAQIEELELSEGERGELYAQLETPISIDDVVASATTPQRAIELYTASRLAIEPDSAAERGYLSLLAARLGLADELVAEVERQTAAAAAAAPAPGPSAAPASPAREA